MNRTVALVVCLLPLLSVEAQLQAHTVAPDAATSWNLGTYGYDQAGNIRQIGSKIYVYDAEGRLSYEKAGTQKQQELTYDGFGNILTITAGTTIRTPGANADTNRAGFGTYDGAGNMITAGTSTFTYDALNVMTKSTTDTSRAYIYNANDERIGVITLTVPNGTEVNSQWTVRDPAGQVLRRFWREGGQWRWMQDYIYRDGKMLASESNDQLKTLHYHLDHLGTPRLITGNGGTEVARHTYYPFGEEVPGPTPQVAEPKKFTGHERDGGGVDYMHARFYEYGMGRFLSVDPVMDVKQAMRVPQAWNRYAYVRNNPVRWTDPTGKYICDGTKDQCKAIEAGLTIVRAAASEATRTRQPGAARLNSIVALYGKAGEKNGVSVVVKATGAPGATGSEKTNLFGKTTLTVDQTYLNSIVSTGKGYVDLAKTAAHEGDHALHDRADMSLRFSTSFSDLLFLERSAWRTENYINSTLGIADSAAAIWMPGSGWNPANLETTARANAAADCSSIPGGCTP